ncbi:MAG: type II toxin-antitoxin system RelE/ParE family toxin [Deltaproteobacteria bacterium]|nr:type II toxin-antitoxin system RelE/ParE family toxin [Deltaproteobacteria bacterium]
MKVKFTPSARAQFLEGLEYIWQDSPTAARHFREKAEKVLRRLEEFPESGRLIPEFPDLPHREVIVRPYRFFYRVSGKTVWVSAVWHSAQLPDGPSI